MSENIEQKLKELVANQLGVKEEQITNESSFMEDLGADSLDVVELVMAFEEEFGVDIPDDDAEKIQNFGQAVEYVKQKKATAGE